jgi:hypothetical protein
MMGGLLDQSHWRDQSYYFLWTLAIAGGSSNPPFVVMRSYRIVVVLLWLQF